MRGGADGRSRRAGAGLLATVVAGAVMSSCGGGVEPESVVGPAPVAVQAPLAGPAPAADGAGVSADAQPAKTLLCHKGKELSLPASAVQAHLNHGDTLGSCTPAVACPCFAPGHGSLQCNSGLVLSYACPPPPYSLVIDCQAAGTGSPDLLVYRLVDTDVGSCYGQTTEGSVFVKGLTDAEIAACKQIIVTDPLYPSGCPS